MAGYDVTTKVNELLASGWTLDELQQQARAAGGKIQFGSIVIWQRGDTYDVNGRATERIVLSLQPKASTDAPADAPERATGRQVEYAVALGGDRAAVESMSKSEASGYIDGLKAAGRARGHAAAQARLAGARLGVTGEIWDEGI